MKKLLSLLFLFLVSIIFIFCNKYSKLVENENIDILKVLNDTLNIFKKVEEFKINKNLIENDSIRIIYYSISKNEFINALNDNKKNIHIFNKHYKFNEKKEFRNKNHLILKNYNDSIQLIDLENTNLNRPTKYFLHAKTDFFYIVKKINFEDSETCFYNTSNLKLEKKIDGITSSFNDNNSIMFYINNFFVVPEEKSQLSFFKIDKNKINYLLNVKVDWFSNFTFFDENNNLYYIHSFYDENFNIKSTYAKMEYYLKN